MLTANNGSPAAGLSKDTFQAYMNAHNGQTPPDAYALSQWAQANPNVTAAGTAQAQSTAPTSVTAAPQPSAVNPGTASTPGTAVATPGGLTAPGTLPGGATTADYVAGLPAPNKIVSRNFNALDPDTQKFLLAAYQQAGYSANDVTNTIAKTQPQFTAPAAGSIAA